MLPASCSAMVGALRGRAKGPPARSRGHKGPRPPPNRVGRPVSAVSCSTQYDPRNHGVLSEHRSTGWALVAVRPYRRRDAGARCECGSRRCPAWPDKIRPAGWLWVGGVRCQSSARAELVATEANSAAPGRVQPSRAALRVQACARTSDAVGFCPGQPDNCGKAGAAARHTAALGSPHRRARHSAVAPLRLLGPVRPFRAASHGRLPRHARSGLLLGS